jgi:hypothetical protein
MRRVIFSLFVVTTVIIACKDKKQNAPQEETTTTDAKTTTRTATADPAADSADIRNLVMDFYNWYSKDYGRFMRYDLYSGIKKKNLPPYKINWDQVAKYQQFIHDSVPQLGDAFIANQKKFFQQCDSAFKADVKDELPYGFDYDWYTDNQEEPQFLLDEINKAKRWVINVNGDDATIDIRGMDDSNKPTEGSLINLKMKKENGQWKIAKIGNE